MCYLDLLVLIVLWNSHELGEDFKHEKDRADVLKKEDRVVVDREFEGSEVHGHEARICNHDEHQTVEICDDSVLWIDEKVFFPILPFLVLLFIILVS